MTITIYGIPNCDTIKKARKWLDAQQIDYQFHNVRKDGLTLEQLTEWANSVGWETLLNKRGTTWRQFSDDIKNNIDEQSALSLMLEHPALIKRPVFIQDQTIIVGFKEAEYQTQLNR